MSDYRTALASFERAVARTVLTCADVTPDDWVARPRQDRHSMSEVLEHMSLSNELFRARLEKIRTAPAAVERYSSLDDDEIPHLFERVDEPPGIAEPSGTWRAPKEAVRRFQESAAGILACADLDERLVRMRGAPHPLFGPLDGVQWALFAAAHTERHRSELIGLKRRLADKEQ
ncbi:MAG: DinB family protein [Hyphomonadaceae bacterium JAD_PAG50586_4]|nr:MAG: DinB family protein [Hyphomonadaceae bacterium JAD_PAG50586_4]